MKRLWKIVKWYFRDRQYWAGVEKAAQNNKWRKAVQDATEKQWREQTDKIRKPRY
jgi:hypothetical protein